jgi:hypothetical protein
MQNSMRWRVVNQENVIFGGRDRETEDGVSVWIRFDVKTLAFENWERYSAS